MTPLQSWGRLPALPHAVASVHAPGELQASVVLSEPLIARGMGRSYGDAALNPFGAVLDLRGLNRFVAFDPASGLIEVEAGVTLRQLRLLGLDRGFHLPVVPGTELVTAGGCIAADVHGKNHHREGTFGHHVLGFELVRTDGSKRWCSRDEHRELFEATIGGLGLTGVISRAQLRVKPGRRAMIRRRCVPFASLHDFLELSAAHEASEFVVAWLDCVGRNAGRGILEVGDGVEAHGAVAERRQRRVPVTPPVSLVCSATVKHFNQLYYAVKSRQRREAVMPSAQFLHPLDAVQDWNRLYGPRGFYQYQCVLPESSAVGALTELLHVVSRSRDGSMLAVLKRFGAAAPAGVMSFARSGITLALDFPNRGAQTLDLFDQLDAIVVMGGGAVYGAKDATMPGELFRLGYPRWRAAWSQRDPGVSSGFLKRVFRDVA